jgi:hypothetical protein
VQEQHENPPDYVPHPYDPKPVADAMQLRANDSAEAVTDELCDVIRRRERVVAMGR